MIRTNIVFIVNVKRVATIKNIITLEVNKNLSLANNKTFLAEAKDKNGSLSLIVYFDINRDGNKGI